MMPRTCVRCGRELMIHAATRLCPSCLLRGGLNIDDPELDLEEPSVEGLLQAQVTGKKEDAPVSCEPEKAGTRRSPAQGFASLPCHFGDYELLEVIARGGMGIVYRARQKSLNRTVAVKMLLAGQFAQPTFVERFRAEAEAVAHLQHPNIVAIHEFGELEGQPFFSMAYVEGKNLAQVMAETAHEHAGFRERAQWLKTIAEAIHYAHQRGIIHRDLKPSNVLIDASNQPRITDFGLAKRLTDDSDLTQTGQVLGSPNYLPPEQAAGKPSEIGSDIYSLGAILYHLLTGRPPFQAESLATLLKLVVEADPVPARLLNPSIPRDLETVCAKCLEKETSRRYATAQEVAEELGRFLEDKPIRARPISSAGKLWRWGRRQPIRAALAVALVLTLGLGSLGVLWQWRRAEHEKTAAQTSELRASRLVYAGDMYSAQRAVEDWDIKKALALLDNQRPSPGAPAKPDLRGWEWRYLWGLCQSDQHSIMLQRSNAIAGLALIADGQQLVLLEMGGHAELWDWPARRKIGVFPNQGTAWRMAVSKAGNMLATVDGDAQGKTCITLCDLTTRQIIKSIPHPNSINSLAFSPDGKLLAVCDLSTKGSLWHVPSGILVTNFPMFMEPYNFEFRVPQFSPDSQILALGDGAREEGVLHEGVIRLLDWHTQRETLLLPSPGEGIGVCSLAFSPDGRTLAAGYGYSDATIRLWDVSRQVLVGQLTGHRAMVSQLCFSPDGRTLYSSSDDQTIGVWDCQTQRMIDRLQGHKGSIKGLALDPEGKTLISSSLDGSVRIWDLHQQRRQPSHIALPIRAGGYCCVPFTADSRHVITAMQTNEVTVWDVATGQAVERFPALGTNNRVAALSPDQKLLAVGGYDGGIKVWDRQAKRLVTNYLAHPIPIIGLVYFDRGTNLVSWAMVPHVQWEMKRWSTATWREVPLASNMFEWCYGFAQSPDLQKVAVAYRSDPVKLWDYDNARLEATLLPATSASFSPVFSGDGKLLAAAADGAGRVWEVATGRELAVIGQNQNYIVSVAFTPEANRLVTGANLGGRLQPAVRVWDYVVHRELLSLWSEGNFTFTTQFSPDGNTLLAVSWQGIVDLWHAPSWAEIEAREKEK